MVRRELRGALNVLEGKVIGQRMKQHRQQDLFRLLNVIEARVSPRKKTIHIIVDTMPPTSIPSIRESAVF